MRTFILVLMTYFGKSDWIAHERTGANEVSLCSYLNKVHVTLINVIQVGFREKPQWPGEVYPDEPSVKKLIKTKNTYPSLFDATEFS